MARSYLNQNNLSRGLRNNNPGNLIYTGETWLGKIPYAQNTDWSGSPSNIVKHFEQFYDVRHGIRAMAYDAVGDIQESNYTLAEYLLEYAPVSENDTTAYINYVSQQTGIHPTDVLSDALNANLLVKLLKAQIEVENGDDAALISEDDIGESINLLPPLILQQIGNWVSENKFGIVGILSAFGIAYTGYQIIKRKKKAA